MGILPQLDCVALKEVKEVVETKLAALDQLAAIVMAIRLDFMIKRFPAAC